MRVKTWRVLVATGTCVALGAALSACGGGSGDSDTVTLKFLNYGDWVGETEIADSRPPTPGSRSNSSRCRTVDLLLWLPSWPRTGRLRPGRRGNATAAGLEAGNLLADFDPASVPNLANLPQEYRDEFRGASRPTSARSGSSTTRRRSRIRRPRGGVFDNASQWTGKIVLPDYDLDVQAIALLALGYDINTTDSGELDEARRRSRRSSRICSRSSARVRRSRWPTGRRSSRSATTMRSPAPTIVTGVGSPAEGTPGYIEGVALLPDSKHSAEALKVPRLPPRTGNLRRVHQQHRCLLPDAVGRTVHRAAHPRQSALRQDTGSKFVVEKFLSAEDTEARAKMWNRIKAS
ncbi:hypothetical protein GS930_10430 [Rhodococcus hoagii]|nr:hypothetical protein [Prescottella equi]